MRDLETYEIVKRTISSFKFSDFLWVSNRPSIADLFKPEKRCGIYILRFKNNQFYVGQAVDVVRRFTQHSKVHEDIQEISFRTYPKEELNSVEEELIKLLERKGVRLRNINLTSIPKGNTDLDLIISREEQLLWLQSNHLNLLNEYIIDEPNLQENYARKAQKLLKRKDFVEIAKPFLIEYFKRCMLQPARTELSFWSLTCLNKAFLDVNNTALCRLNLFWCEVLTIWLDNDNKVRFTFHLTKSLLSRFDIIKIKLKTKSLLTFDHYYQRGGPDQFSIEVTGLNDAMKLLKNDKIVMAIKTFNLRQMQKGATVYGKYHCIDLAKSILTEDVNR